MYTVLEEELGTPTRKHQDWFDDHDADIKVLLETKHQLFRSHIENPNSVPKKDAYFRAKKDCQRYLRRMQDNWFSNKAEEIERYAASNNSKEFYRSLNAIYGRCNILTHTLTLTHIISHNTKCMYHLHSQHEPLIITTTITEIVPPFQSNKDY